MAGRTRRVSGAGARPAARPRARRPDCLRNGVVDEASDGWDVPEVAFRLGSRVRGT